MSPLLGLPNEILHQIFSNVPHADIDNTSLICRGIYEATTYLRREHTKRKQEYNSITCGLTEPAVVYSASSHPSLVFFDLLADDLFYYPTSIRVAGHRHKATWGNPFGDPQSTIFKPFEVVEPLDSLSWSIEPLLGACKYLEGDPYLQDALKHGEAGVTLGIILTLLPNLKSIHFIDNNVHSIASMNLNKIARNIVKADQSSAGTRSQALCKLTNLSITHGDELDPQREGFAYYWPFFHLSSLRSLRGHHINASQEDWSYARLICNIEEIDLNCSSVDAQSFDNCLQDIKNLRKFKFHRVPIDETASCDSSLPHLVRCLVRYASHSLTSLDITFDQTRPFFPAWEDHLTVTLKTFRILEYVRLAGALFHEYVGILHPVFGTHGTKPSRIPRLVDFLPASIRRIDLACEIETHTAFTLLAGLPVMRADSLPSLDTIYFDCHSTDLVESANEMRQVFGNCGIQLTVGTQGKSD